MMNRIRSGRMMKVSSRNVKRRLFSSNESVDKMKLKGYRDFVKPVIFSGIICSVNFISAMIYEEERSRYIHKYLKENYPFLSSEEDYCKVKEQTSKSEIVRFWYFLSNGVKAMIPIIGMNIFVFIKHHFISPIKYCTYCPTVSSPIALLVFIFISPFFHYKSLYLVGSIVSLIFCGVLLNKGNTEEFFSFYISSSVLSGLIGHFLSILRYKIPFYLNLSKYIIPLPILYGSVPLIVSIDALTNFKEKKKKFDGLFFTFFLFYLVGENTAHFLGGYISAWIYFHFENIIWNDWKSKFIKQYRKYRPLDNSFE